MHPENPTITNQYIIKIIFSQDFVQIPNNVLVFKKFNKVQS